MDKTLEIIMVAVALVVAVVIVVGMLQGQANNFGNFSETQTTSSSCSISVNKLKPYCPGNSGSGSWDQSAAQNIVDSAPSSCSLNPGSVC